MNPISSLLKSLDPNAPIKEIRLESIGKHSLLYLESDQVISETFDNEYVSHPHKYVITCLLDSGTVKEFLHIFELVSNISKVKQLSLLVLEIYFSTPQDASLHYISQFEQFGHEFKIDLCLQRDTITRTHKRLFVFDMDSTLIQQEVIDELARECGVYEFVSQVTEEAMRGLLDFNQSLEKRVALLKGFPVSIIEKVKQRIAFMPGAKELCKGLKKLGIKMAVVSGGFMPLATFVKQELQLDYAFANTLEMEDGLLTGKVTYPIVNAQKKQDILLHLAHVKGIQKEQIGAVGDGANDLLMLSSADLGIAYNAKEKVQKAAKVRINKPSLVNVLYLLGLCDQDISNLIN